MRPVHQKKFSWEEEHILRRHRSTMWSTVFLTILCCYVIAGLPLENKVNSNNNVRKFLEIQERLSKEKSESAPEPEPTPTSSSKDNDTVSAKDISITDHCIKSLYLACVVPFKAATGKSSKTCGVVDLCHCIGKHVNESVKCENNTKAKKTILNAIEFLYKEFIAIDLCPDFEDRKDIVESFVKFEELKEHEESHFEDEDDHKDEHDDLKDYDSYDHEDDHDHDHHYKDDDMEYHTDLDHTEHTLSSPDSDHTDLEHPLIDMVDVFTHGDDQKDNETSKVVVEGKGSENNTDDHTDSEHPLIDMVNVFLHGEDKKDNSTDDSHLSWTKETDSDYTTTDEDHTLDNTDKDQEWDKDEDHTGWVNHFTDDGDKLNKGLKGHSWENEDDEDHSWGAYLWGNHGTDEDHEGDWSNKNETDKVHESGKNDTYSHEWEIASEGNATEAENYNVTKETTEGNVTETWDPTEYWGKDDGTEIDDHWYTGDETENTDDSADGHKSHDEKEATSTFAAFEKEVEDTGKELAGMVLSLFSYGTEDV